MPLILKTAVSKVTNPTVTININDFRPSIAYLITDSLTFDYENILKNEFTTPYYPLSYNSSYPLSSNTYDLIVPNVFSLLKSITVNKLFADQGSSTPIKTRFDNYEFRFGVVSPETILGADDVKSVKNENTGYYACLLKSIRQPNGKSSYCTYKPLNIQNFSISSNISLM